MSGAPPQITRLAWTDPALGALALPAGRLSLRAGFGSGLTRRRGAPPGRVWAVGDRGPNLKLDAAIALGLTALAPLRGRAGAKLMPRLDIGPAIAELQVAGDRVELLRTLRLTDSEGIPLSGLPPPGADHSRQEPVFGLAGEPLGCDPAGVDSEGIAALADGGFWIGDEYGPSLVRIDPCGRVIARWLPQGAAAVRDGIAALPAIAGRRQLNRGFEAIALSPDEAWLWVAFQSPLAHPDESTHRRARHVRIWRLDASSGAVAAQYLYPLDPPESFGRDAAQGCVDWSDLKVSEILATGEQELLVLERASRTTKIYRVAFAGVEPVAELHLDVASRPSLEEMSAAGTLDQPVLDKSLLFSSDGAPEVDADLEGMVALSSTDLLLVSDNDFGVEGAHTGFWRLRFAEPILR